MQRNISSILLREGNTVAYRHIVISCAQWKKRIDRDQIG